MVVMEYLSGWAMLGETPREERLQYASFMIATSCGEEGVKRYPREWDHTQLRKDAKEAYEEAS